MVGSLGLSIPEVARPPAAALVSNLTFVNTVAGGRTTAGTSTGINYTGSGIAAGDLAVGGFWNTTGGGPSNLAALGYTSLGSVAIGTSRGLTVFYKELAGTETTENFTHASMVTMVQMVIFRNWDNTQDLSLDVDVAALAAGADATPDPPVSVAPTFADAKVWLLFLGTGTGTPTGVPTNYSTDELNHNDNAGSLGINSVYREDIDGDTATEDPDDWTLPAAETYNASGLVAIKSS